MEAAFEGFHYLLYIDKSFFLLTFIRKLIESPPGPPRKTLIPAPRSGRVDMIPFYPLKGVAGVDDEAGLGGDPGIVIGRVVRHQQHQVAFYKGALVQRRR